MARKNKSGVPSLRASRSLSIVFMHVGEAFESLRRGSYEASNLRASLMASVQPQECFVWVFLDDNSWTS